MPKILVADDSMAVRKVAERHLTQVGMEVTLAASGEEAVALLAHERPDLIVCDVIMPDKSGYDVCTFTRSQSTLANTPFLLISGIVNAEVTKQAETCGANGVLKKPFQGNSLQDRVMELLGGKPTAGAAGPAAAASERASPSGGADGATALAQVKAEVEQLRTALAQEQAQTQALRQQLTEAESALTREREAAAELGRQAGQVDQSVTRIAELEAQVEREREASAKAQRRMAELEQSARRVEELETLLARECDQTARMTERLASAEQGAGRVEELETLLASERERTAKLQKDLAEAQQRAQEAVVRQEELTRKLSQIASLST